MKKIITTFVVLSSVIFALSAYNPPAGGENLFEYSSPDSLSGKTSVTGGALFSAGPDSLVINPALAAREQRINLNAGYTFLLSSNDENKHKIGSAFQIGLLVPTQLYIYSGYINGTFVPFSEMNVGNSINIKGSISKEMTDKLDVGVGLNTGIIWDNKVDWELSANLGFNYHFGDLGFLKDFRYGASILNLGKNYKLPANNGLKESKSSSHFPSILTIKAGASGTVFQNEDINIGVALDLSTAMFMNLSIDLSSQVLINDMIYFNVGERINIAEAANKHWNAIPSISVGFKFPLNINNNQYLEDKGWNKSDMTVSAGYRNLYGSVNAISAGVDIDLGMEDTTKPEIKFLDDEE